MMPDEPDETRECPKCGAADVQVRGVVVARLPYERPAALGAYHRVTEHKYECAECGAEFSEIAHHYN